MKNKNKKIVKIILLTSEGCSSCKSAKEILENEVKPNFPEVEIEYVDMLSEKGQKLIQKYTIMASPGIIINGELFSSGGLEKNKLIEKIKSL